MKLGSLFPFGSKTSSTSSSESAEAAADKKLPAGFRAGRRGSSDDAVQRARVVSLSPRCSDDMAAMCGGSGLKYPSTSAEAQANQVAALGLLDKKEYACTVRQR
ncbi:uncharacterized protein ACA1_184240 [Acanthamoeba castellanii str. Neff]|uniref:Uncharacterized protein n=1 Tax=Acanthamoeba castellanii (strain ATCC 30010 / Neff) TaxID=1257118 RepID=L8H9S7_ACACF|nr:uncharacterized protein ACA1_184240 [Acanthamoeba castellanii str. Neff]ELR21478.1 hypothetical protein ACA1_184240 [Acanthamoeba castellanii str. Neff]